MAVPWHVIDGTRLPTSVMPEGLVADLSVAQFASLLDSIEGMKVK